MNALLLLLLPVALASPSEYIVGGSDIDIADYPFQGSYRTGAGSHTCGCIFVGGEWALTAGHCGGSSAYSMEFGGTNRGSGSVFDISAVTRHPQYDQGDGFTPNDIAVVQATSAISGENIAAGIIAPNANNPGVNGWITGWGRTCGTCALPIILQGTEIPIISDAECTGIYGNDFQASNMICVWGGQGGGIGSCNGDSGGPLSVGNTIYGITSWGVVGCNTNFPSTYNRVGAFNAWVCTTTGNGAAGC